MAHVRTQIREAFKSALDDNLPSGYVVYSSRKYARNIVDGEAIIDMRFLNDQSQGYETMDGSRTHVGSLYIRVQRSADEVDLDDALDGDEVAVVTAVENTDWSDLLEEDPELLQVNFSDNAEGDRPIGAIVIRYDVEYRINKSDPETVIE